MPTYIKELDSFIGTTHGPDKQLTVIDRNALSDKQGVYKYKIHCSICEKDTELYGDGTFYAYKGGILQGNLPCGCVRNRKRTMHEVLISIKRACEEAKYEFLGFVDNYVNGKTKAILKCKVHGNIWKTTNVNSLIHNLKGCPICRGEAISKAKLESDESINTELKKLTQFSNIEKFWRDAKTQRINYTCNICSHDMYTKAGLCSGVFQTLLDSLKKGSLACRCNKFSIMTREMVELRINTTLQNEEKYTFVGWETPFVDFKNKIVLNCKEHGDWPAILGSLFRGSRCPSCSINGFSPVKDAFVYVIEAENSSISFVGYGITRYLEKRIKDHSVNLSKKGFTIKTVRHFHTTGIEALKLENDLINMFPIYSQDVSGFRREATYPHHYTEVISHLENSVTTVFTT